MVSIVKNVLAGFGVDRVFATNLATRVWMLVFGPVVLGCIVGSLSIGEQGFYFTFLSLLALSVFLDMGFTRAVQVFISHEFGTLALRRWAPLEGNPAARGRIADFGKAVILAHICLALVAGFGIGFIGEAVFSSNDASNVTWHGPWWSIAFASSASFLLAPMHTMLESAGHVPYMAGVKLIRQVCTNVALVVALFSGMGLYAAALSAWVGLFVALVLTIVPYSAFWKELSVGSVHSGFALVRELLPYQVRIAVSWGAGYLIFSVMTPIAFAVLGPEEAGRVGLSWQIMAIISSIAFSIIQARTPLFGTLLAQGKQGEAFALAKRATRGASFIATCGFTALIVCIACVRHFPEFGWPGIATSGVARMLPEFSIAILAIAEIAKLRVLGLVAYVRSYKVEPFMPMFISLALVVPAACWVLAKWQGAEWLCIGYALGQLLAIPWSRSAARRYTEDMI